MVDLLLCGIYRHNFIQSVFRKTIATPDIIQ